MIPEVLKDHNWTHDLFSSLRLSVKPCFKPLPHDHHPHPTPMPASLASSVVQIRTYVSVLPEMATERPWLIDHLLSQVPIITEHISRDRDKGGILGQSTCQKPSKEEKD